MLIAAVAHQVVVLLLVQNRLSRLVNLRVSWQVEFVLKF